MLVAVQKGADVFVGRGDDDSRIGHPRDFDIVQVVGDAEALPKRGFQRVYAGAPRMDKGAIDIEKKQALAHFCHVERKSCPERSRMGRDISYCYSENVQLNPSVLLLIRLLDRASLRSE